MTLEDRLTHVERSLNRYRIIMLVLVAIIAAGGIMAFNNGVDDVTRTRRLEVVNDHGQPVGVFTVGSDGAGELQTFYATGKQCFYVSGYQDDDIGGARLYNGRGSLLWKAEH